MAKIAISLPDELLQAMEQERLARGESRSAFCRRAVEQLLHKEDEQEAIRQYIEAYRKHPETAEEIALAEAVLGEALKENPWEDEPRE